MQTRKATRANRRENDASGRHPKLSSASCNLHLLPLHPSCWQNGHLS